MTLTNLEFAHVRLVRRCRHIVDERRASPNRPPAIHQPALMERLLSEKVGLFSAADRASLDALCDVGSADITRASLFIEGRLEQGLSTLVLYPSRDERRRRRIKRGYGMLPTQPLDPEVQGYLRAISIIVAEYLTIKHVIAAASRPLRAGLDAQN